MVVPDSFVIDTLPGVGAVVVGVDDPPLPPPPQANKSEIIGTINSQAGGLLKIIITPFGLRFLVTAISNSCQLLINK
jgi:hypothetical protein